MADIHQEPMSLVCLQHFRHEASMAWQNFSTFLLIHTIFLGFILSFTIQSPNELTPMAHIVTIMALVVGEILSILWLISFMRYRLNYFVRKSQVIDVGKTEPMKILGVQGIGIELPPDTRSKTIGLNHYRYNMGGGLYQYGIAIWLYPTIIAIFAGVYSFLLLLIFDCGPCWATLAAILTIVFMLTSSYLFRGWRIDSEETKNKQKPVPRVWFSIRCFNCTKKFRIKSSYGVKVFQCPYCGKKLRKIAEGHAEKTTIPP